MLVMNGLVLRTYRTIKGTQIETRRNSSDDKKTDAVPLIPIIYLLNLALNVGSFVNGISAFLNNNIWIVC